MVGHGELTGEGGEGKGKGERGHSWGGHHGGHGEGLLGAARPLLLRVASLFGTTCM
jgi:hypothetical protein